MVKPLTVYKASAGSGKTFTLATEYIKLLVINPNSYRNILAVTFTNKATEEMKMRILSQLYGIWKQLPDSKQYMRRIVESTGYDEQVVSERAGEALRLLLHNYNYFRVETIDSFFQSVLRNLARELELTANLRISLNDGQVEEQAVDQLIDSLQHTDLMLQWLLSVIMEKISDDRSWNIIGQVKKFGKTIFRDYYKEHSEALNRTMDQQGFIEGYTQQLRDISQTALERMQEIADSFFDALAGEGIEPTELAYGYSGVAGMFKKIKEGCIDSSIVGSRVKDCAGDPAKWYTKKCQMPELVHEMAESELMPILNYTLSERPKQYRLYQSAELTRRHLNQLRLLGSIEQKVRTLNIDANRFLLSDTQQLLHALMKDDDSPFIFEKIGSQLEHIMIDEFQDTSTVQWMNFKVLLNECMSHQNTENLIVGDVKQSIYRWRSGDWQLLNAIDQQFQHPQETLTIEPLDTNYRSEKNIVDFNNAFFTEAAQQEYDTLNAVYPQGAKKLQQAYSDVVQKTPEGREEQGLVTLSLLPAKDYEERTLQQMGETIAWLHEQGADYSEMAILVRANKHIPVIADYFANHMPEVKIVSNEAFRLDASVAVCLLVQALHLLTHPDDSLAKAKVVKLYRRSVLHDDTDEATLFFKEQPMDDWLPEAFTQHRDELIRLPLYELVERLYEIFELKKLNEQSAFLCAFYDQLNAFTQDNSTDIDAFVREWEESIGSKTIQSDFEDGIRILSIHKSKGLEFNHVIIPFCDWKLEHADILWCIPDEEPFSALPIAPIDYSSKMRETIYEDDYQQEHLQNSVDNLNLLYVAFTRAVKNLFVIGQRDQKGRSALLQSVLPELKLKDNVLTGTEDKQSDLKYTFGTLSIKQKKEDKEKSENVFLQPITPQQITIENFNLKTVFQQSNRSKDFVEGNDEQQEMSYIKIGSVLHEIFSTIKTTADIPQALSLLQSEGILYDDEVTREKLSTMIKKRLEDNRVRNWFSDGWNLFNECSILQLDEHGEVVTKRPDRVITNGKETLVIDFKFGRPHEDYHEQVREYMQLLSDMNMPNVTGWLWYVYTNKIEQVEGVK